MPIEILRPNSDVSIQLSRSSGGSSYALVDDTGSGDGDSTYVYRSVEDGYVRDLYGIPSLPGAIASINSITVWTRSRRTAGAGGESKRVIKTHGVEYESGIAYEGSSYGFYGRDWATNPYTGSAWTVQEITDLQIGIALRLPAGVGGDVRCTQVYVSVDYDVAIPAVSTQAVSGVQPTTATGNGNITHTGGENAHTRGICWNTAGTPTTADPKSEDNGGGSYSTGAYSKSMATLTPGTLYYVRAYAINSAGTGYGNEVTFYSSKVVTSSDTGSGADAFTIKGMTTTDTGVGTDALYKTRTWTEPLELTIDAVTAYRVRFWVEKADDIDEIDLDVYWGGAYNDVYEGGFVGGKWESKTFTQNSITKAKVKFLVDPAYTVKLYDLAFYKVIE